MPDPECFVSHLPHIIHVWYIYNLPLLDSYEKWYGKYTIVPWMLCTGMNFRNIIFQVPAWEIGELLQSFLLKTCMICWIFSPPCFNTRKKIRTGSLDNKKITIRCWPLKYFVFNLTLGNVMKCYDHFFQNGVGSTTN